MPAHSDSPLHFVNRQSIISMQGAFKNLVECFRPDIIIATETWLDASAADSELELHNYLIFKKDRPRGKHGGVVIAIVESISCSKTAFKNPENSDILWVRVKGHLGRWVLPIKHMQTIYHPGSRQITGKPNPEENTPDGYHSSWRLPNFPGITWPR